MRATLAIGLTALLLTIGAAAGETPAAPPPGAPHSGPAETLAVFPVELWDTSGEGAKPDQAAKLQHATAILASTLEQTGRYRPVDLAPYTEAIAKTEPRYNCNGCWRPIASQAGAQFAVLATIHKVSSLISSFDIQIADVTTGKLAAYASGQFRGDDDQSYTRSIAFLVRERLFNAEAQSAAGR
jgi:hypothetical protein